MKFVWFIFLVLAQAAVASEPDRTTGVQVGVAGFTAYAARPLANRWVSGSELASLARGGAGSTAPALRTYLPRVASMALPWLATSVAVNAAVGVVDQLRENHWNPFRVDWSEPARRCMDRRFWGGTAGSFFGALGGYALATTVVAVPPVLRILATFAGAALGWQIGCEQLAQTDWASLAASTALSATGFVIGAALGGGPIGAMAGAMAGQWLANELVDYLRCYLSTLPVASREDYVLVNPGSDVTVSPSTDPFADVRNSAR